MYPNLNRQIWKSGIPPESPCRELNMDQTLLSKIIHGYRQPSRQMKVRGAQYLRIDEARLLELDSDDSPKPQPRRTQARGAAE